MVLATLFRSLMNFELIFVCGVRQGSSSIFYMWMSSFFHIVLFLLYIVDTLLENHLTTYMQGFISRFSTPLFYMFFCQYYTVLIILALQLDFFNFN